MNTTVFDTQKVCADLTHELVLLSAEEENTVDVSARLEINRAIRWLKSKLAFLESPEYQTRKQWTVECECTLDGSDTSMSAQLDEAGFGSFGPM